MMLIEDADGDMFVRTQNLYEPGLSAQFITREYVAKPGAGNFEKGVLEVARRVRASQSLFRLNRKSQGQPS